MKKFILFILLMFVIATIGGMFMGKKRIIKNGVLKIGAEIWKVAPRGVSANQVSSRMNNALIAVERDNFSFKNINKIDSILKILKNNNLDSSEFLGYLRELDNYIDTVKH